jgi:hypothetical protein
MRLIREPCLATSIGPAVHGAQDALGTRQFTPNGRSRHAPLTHPEEGAQVSVARRIKDDALTQLDMGNALAWRK